MSRIVSAGVFEMLLGPRFQDLCPAVRAVHSGRTVELTGQASVTCGTSLGARVLCHLVRLPDAQRDGPVRVTLEASANGETWSRWYGASPVMRSRIERRGSLLVERFGALALHFRVAVKDGDLVWVPVGCSVLGIPLPAWMLGGISARASGRNGRYAFAVGVRLPVVGLVISYEGVADVAG
jgi:hypothetical protein